MKTYAKFAVLVVLIIGTLAWLAAGGINETKTYYKTIAELDQMKSAAGGKRLRVAGDVETGSIVRKGRDVEFVMKQDALRLKVVYKGVDPLPDTFRDGAQALADGKLDASGVFQANKIQAKCASKYEAKPVQKAPVNERRQTS
ncbi:MAG: cytochrome c maturation protein CcmE [Acidobacteria bacterium]|nr:cytochrome c maturation protein CcmE [Acidobacteriota bacterium]